MTVTDPATGRPADDFVDAGPVDVDRAVRAARAAGTRTWSRTGVADRARCLRRLAEALTARAGELGGLDVRATGLPARQARAGVIAAAADLMRAAAWAERIGGTGRGDAAGAVPAGVVAAVVAADAPLLDLVRLAGPALAAGCAVVVKPARGAPGSALALAEAAAVAGLPPGVLNVVAGGTGTGQALLAHPLVDVVAVRGRPRTVAQIRRDVAGTGRVVVALSGRPVVMIALPDADPAAAAAAAVAGIGDRLSRTGGAGSLLAVPDRRTAEVIDLVHERLSHLRVGDPRDPATDVGPVPSSHRLNRVRERLRAAVRAGARSRSGPVPPASGWWLAPTVLTDLPDSAAAARDPLGPVLSVRGYASTDDLPDLLGPGIPVASVWTADPTAVLGLAGPLGATCLVVNAAPDPAWPAVGWDAAGRGGAAGRDGLSPFLRTTGSR